MAIVTEHFLVGEKDFIKTYSDAGRYVHGGFPVGDYTEACDPAEYGRTYTEGDTIPLDDNEAKEILYILTGGVL